MKERTLSRKTVFSGRIIELEVHEVELEPGVVTTREVVRHDGAVAVLARIVDGGDFLLVRQYRKAVESEALEIVAGCLEQGEKPEDCAVREVKEETGFDAVSLRKLGIIWPSPGYSSEELHLYFAEVGRGGGAPCPDGDERIATVTVTETEMERMIAENRLRDAKSVAAWCLWKGASA